MFISTFLVLIGKRGTVFTEKKSKTVTPSRRLQATQKAKRSTLQMDKYTKVVRKIYHSFRFNDKNAFRKLDICIFLIFQLYARAYLRIWTLLSWYIIHFCFGLFPSQTVMLRSLFQTLSIWVKFWSRCDHLDESYLADLSVALAHFS